MELTTEEVNIIQSLRDEHIRVLEKLFIRSYELDEQTDLSDELLGQRVRGQMEAKKLIQLYFQDLYRTHTQRKTTAKPVAPS